MQIHQGTPALKNFIQFYEKSTSFKFQNRQYPIVVLLDNDKEAQGVVNLIKNSYKKENVVYDRYNNFSYDVTSNLYVIILPTKQNRDNKIEDLFDPLFTAKILNGKTFSSENGDEFDSDKHYSKTVFANRVVRPQQENIDFTKFKEILELISKVIIDYNNPKPQ